MRKSITPSSGVRYSMMRLKSKLDIVSTCFDVYQPKTYPLMKYNLPLTLIQHFSYTVVAQAYKVDVEVLAAPRGCTAIMRCVVPTFVKELVRVVSWVQEPAFYIYPSLQGGKFLLKKLQ